LLARKLAVIALTAALVAAFGVGSSTGSTRSAAVFHSVVVAKLSPKAEVVGKGSPGASGTVRVTIDLKTNKACWRLTLNGLNTKDKFLSSDVHKAPPSQTGPVVIPLGYATKGCVVVPKTSQLKAVGTKPGAYYVNVYTKKYLHGAVRGQLRAG
jgi:hypothetical protein